MIWTSISDIHIKPKDEESKKILLSFLEKSYQLQAQKIFLLGDIFDLMVGSHEEYIDQYKDIFLKLVEGSKKDIEFYFFEGNHDFHLEKLWKAYAKRFEVDPVKYVNEEIVLEQNNKRILLSHGDNSSLEDKDYILYKGFIRSTFIKVLSTKIVPYKLVKRIGEWASNKSRKYSSSYELKEEIKNKYRRIAIFEATKHKAEVVIAGHSHIEDKYKENGISYINNGMSLRTKKYVIIKDGDVNLESLVTF